MLEKHYVSAATIDRIRGSWIVGDIEAYVEWLDSQGYSSKSVLHRVPVLFAFGEFARARGATTTAEPPDHVEAFVAGQVARPHARTGPSGALANEVRGPIEQMLVVALPGFTPSRRRQHAEPFARQRRGKGGRPPSFDAEAYKDRNAVERAINKLRATRAVATRYDCDFVYRGTIDVASIRIWLRDPVISHSRDTA